MLIDFDLYFVRIFLVVKGGKNGRVKIGWEILR